MNTHPAWPVRIGNDSPAHWPCTQRGLPNTMSTRTHQTQRFPNRHCKHRHWEDTEHCFLKTMVYGVRRPIPKIEGPKLRPDSGHKNGGPRAVTHGPVTSRSPPFLRPENGRKTSATRLLAVPGFLRKLGSQMDRKKTSIF